MTGLEILHVVRDFCWAVQPLIWLNTARMAAKHETWIQQKLKEHELEQTAPERIFVEALKKQSKLK